MTLIEALQRKHRFTTTEEMLADFVLAHPNEVVAMSASQLAKAAHTSNSAIVRFCSKLGIDGYRSFNVTLARELERRSVPPTSRSWREPPHRRSSTQWQHSPSRRSMRRMTQSASKTFARPPASYAWRGGWSSTQTATHASQPSAFRTSCSSLVSSAHWETSTARPPTWPTRSVQMMLRSSCHTREGSSMHRLTHSSESWTSCARAATIM